MLREGFETGLSKQQISNVFANPEALDAANVSSLTAIDTLSGVRSGKMKAVRNLAFRVLATSHLMLLFRNCTKLS